MELLLFLAKLSFILIERDDFINYLPPTYVNQYKEIGC